MVRFFTAAAPPPAAVLAAMREAGFEVTHLYGLTETYGPAVVNDWKDEWNALDAAAQAAMKSRQGVRYHALEALDVIDPETMRSVPADGETMGEVMFRGNVVMKGYLKNKASTDKAFAGGWFHSGDLGVKHPDGYIQLKDRSKDIIISGGENISSIEVEDALFQHPSVQLAAVVARARRQMGRDALRLRRAEARPQRHRGRADRLVPHAARPLQMPAPCRFRRDPQDLDRQGAEIRLARAGPRGRAAVTASRKSGWPPHCRAALARALRLASRQFPRAGEDEATRVHDVRKTLKGAAGLARLFTDLVGAPAEATLDAINAARRKVGRARDLDILPGVIAALDPPPETRDALIAAIAEQREAERRAHHDIDVGGLAAELRALADSVEAWDVEAAGATPLIAALRRSYRSARRRGEAALPGGAPRELHG